MKKLAKDLTEREYLHRLLIADPPKNPQGRIRHHTRNIERVFPVLFTVLKALADEMDIRTQNGNTANMGWARLKGGKVAFVYDHAGGRIVAKKKGSRGVAASFTDADTLTDVINKVQVL